MASIDLQAGLQLKRLGFFQEKVVKPVERIQIISNITETKYRRAAKRRQKAFFVPRPMLFSTFVFPASRNCVYDPNRISLDYDFMAIYDNNSSGLEWSFHNQRNDTLKNMSFYVC